jgi:hypothetical protein
LGIFSFFGIPNSCEIEYCAPPCLEDIQDAKDDYIAKIDKYNDEVENYIAAVSMQNQSKIDSSRSKAIYFRRSASKASYDVITHMMIDTLDYRPDSLITWLGYLDTYGAELMIAGEYASNNDFESALDVLESIAMSRELSPPQEKDLDNMITIYSLLDEKAIASLDYQDRSTLRSIAYANVGMSAGVARAVLSYYKEYVPLPYYVGQQIKFRTSEPASGQENKTTSDETKLKIYPNPAGNFVTITWDKSKFQPENIVVIDMYGHKISGLNKVLHPLTVMETIAWPDGIYWIIAQSRNGNIISGKVAIIRN